MPSGKKPKRGRLFGRDMTATFLLSAGMALAGCAAQPGGGAGVAATAAQAPRKESQNTSAAALPGKPVDFATGDAAYLAAIQSAILRNDRQWLADQILPDASVTAIKGEDATIKSKKDFLDHYDDIITPAVRSEIAGMTPRDLYRDWKGVAGGFVLSFDQIAPMDHGTGKVTEPMRYRISGLGRLAVNDAERTEPDEPAPPPAKAARKIPSAPSK